MAFVVSSCEVDINHFRKLSASLRHRTTPFIVRALGLILRLIVHSLEYHLFFFDRLPEFPLNSIARQGHFADTRLYPNLRHVSASILESLYSACYFVECQSSTFVYRCKGRASITCLKLDSEKKPQPQ